MPRLRLWMGLLFVFASMGTPAARAQQVQPPSSNPTPLEFGFADQYFSIPTNPMGSLQMLNDVPTFIGGGGPFALDSREVVHMVGLANDTAPDGIHPRVSLTYANNIPETRRAGGFSEPIFLKQVVQRTPSETPQPGDSDGIHGLGIMVDVNDVVHVFWTEGINVPPPSDPTLYFPFPNTYSSRIFHTALTGSSWSTPTQITPDVLPGFNTNEFPPSTFQNVIGQVDYPFPRLTLGGDGLVHLLVSVSLTYNFIVPSYYNNAPAAFVRGANASLLGTPDGSWQFLPQMSDQFQVLYDLQSGVPINEYISFTRYTEAFAVGPGGAPLFFWWDLFNANTGTGYDPGILYYGSISGRTRYAEPTFGGMQFLQYDSHGVLHLVWQTLDGRMGFRDNIDGPVQFQSDLLFVSAWTLDARDQLHQFSFRRPQGLGYPSLSAFSRLRDASGQLSPTFVRTGDITFGHQVIDSVPGLFALSKSNRIYWYMNSGYVTSQSAFGVRDSAAMAGALPGGPVNVTNGNVVAGIPLYSASGVGPTQSLNLVYNSLESADSLVGKSWKLSAEVYLIDSQLGWNSVNDRMTLVQADNHRVTFTYNATYGALVTDINQGMQARIERQGTTSREYKLTMKSGEVLWFNSSGRLRQVVDTTGNYTDFVYDGPKGSGHLVNILDLNGRRSTQLTYEPSNPRYGSRVLQVTDPGGSRYDFAYQARSLASVSFSSGPGSPTYAFEYYPADDPATGARLGLLSKFKTPRARDGNYFWSCFYHLNGRLAQVQDPSEIYLSEGVSDATTPAAGSASVSLRFSEFSGTWYTDRRGFRTRFVGDLASLVYEIDDEASLAQTPGITSILRAFDFQGNLTDVRDRWGFHTSYTFDYVNSTPGYIQDNLLSVKRPKAQGPGQDLVATYTYTKDGLNRVLTATTYATPADGSDAVARTTTYDHNSAGQVTAIHYPDVRYPNGSTQTDVHSTFEYKGPQSQLTRSVNENGHGMTYSNFDASGLAQNALADGGADPRMIQYDVMGNLHQSKEPHGGVMNEATNWTVLNRDGLYRVTSQIDPKGKITTFDYDIDSNPVQVTPPIGGETVTTYDRRGLVSGGTTPDGSWSQWVDAAGNVRRSQDYRGFIANRDLDFKGRVVEVRSPGASTVSGGGGGQTMEIVRYAYDLLEGGGHSSSVTEVGSPSNRVTRTYFDHRGRPELVLAPDGLTSVWTFYDELDHVVASQQVYGSEVQQCEVRFLDARDRLCQVRRQNGGYGGGASSKQSSTYTLYDPAGNVQQAVDELGHVGEPGQAHKQTFLYDVRERLQFVIDGKGIVVRENAYGDDDLLIETRVPDPQTKSEVMVIHATYTYSARKERLTVLDRDGKGTTFTYGDLPGQLLKATDPLGQVTQTQYDPSTLRVKEVIEALGSGSENRTKYEWEKGFLTQTQVWNPDSQAYDATFRRSYDRAGRLEKLEAPMVAPEQYFYNGFSEMSQTVAGTRTVAATYNSLGQPVQKTWSGAYSVQQTMTYDGAGNQKSIGDGNLGRAVSYEAWKGAPLDEAFSVGGAIWKLQTHSVDDAGNYVGLSDPEAKIHEWPVDENNRPTQKRYDNQTVASLSYTPGGLIDREVVRNAAGLPIATTTHTYDGLGRRAGSQTVDASGQVLSEYGWDYNVRGDVGQVHMAHLSAHFTIGIDERGRVTASVTPGNEGGLALPPPYDNQIGAATAGVESEPSSTLELTPKAMLAVPARNSSYTYAPGGNRLSQTVDGVTTTYAYNAANQLISETAPNRTVAHVYDEWGNEWVRTTTVVTQTPQGPVSETTREDYGYNHQNLLSMYSNSKTGALWQYDYYPTGERYGKTNLKDGTGEMYVPRFGDVVTEYNRTASTSNIAITPKNSYVQGTGIDSKSMRVSSQGARSHFLTDMVGTVGMTLSDAGAAVDVSVKDPWGVQIAGGTSERYGAVAQREVDTESGLVYMRHRMYDPRLGRFTQTDPILGRRATAHYSYASNNPISRIDPRGLQDNTYTMTAGADGRWRTQPTSTVEKDIAALRALRRLEGGSDYWLERQERWRLWAIEQAKQGNPEPLKAYDQNYAGELVLALQPARMLENLAAARTVMNLAEPLAVVRLGERARSGAGVKLTPEPTVDAEAAERNLAAKNIREARNFLMENRPDLTPAQRNQVIRGFEPETLKITRLNEEVLDYRYYGGAAKIGGRWSTPEWIDSPAERISRLALPNNLATEAATVKLKPGTTVFEGETAPQFNYGSDKVGSAYQRYNALGPRSLIEGVE